MARKHKTCRNFCQFIKKIDTYITWIFRFEVFAVTLVYLTQVLFSKLLILSFSHTHTHTHIQYMSKLVAGLAGC